MEKRKELALVYRTRKWYVFQYVESPSKLVGEIMSVWKVEVLISRITILDTIPILLSSGYGGFVWRLFLLLQSGLLFYNDWYIHVSEP